jgi:hypothetical protein
MRIHPLLPLVVGLVVAGCDDTGGPPTDGRLVVSTSTEGELLDPRGYLLAVGALDTLVLDPSGTVELDVPAGTHRLRLLDVAEHCSVDPGTSLEVDVAPGAATPVDFVIDCRSTGVRVTMTTTGLDIDPDGYRITVNAAEWGGVLTNGTALLRLDPGERIIAVTGLAPNCAIEGPDSRTVTIPDDEVVPLLFAAVCTAASGVISVVVAAEGIDTEGEYVATLDETPYPVQAGQPTHWTGVAPGYHVVTLTAPANCSVQTDPQSVTLTAGGPVRDTVAVSFAVTCVARLGTVRVTASTTGTPPAHDYSVWACEVGFYCRFYPFLLGALEPNGALLVQIQAGSYELWLEDVPTACGLAGPRTFSIALRDTLDVLYSFACP